MEELKLCLPAPLGDVIEPHEHQIKNVDVMGANTPGWVPVLFHLAALMFLCKTMRMKYHKSRNESYRNEASDGFGHVLSQFRTCNRPRRVAEIPGWDLTAPRLVTWPLKFVRRQDRYHSKAARGETYIDANRNRGPTLLEHGFVA